VSGFVTSSEEPKLDTEGLGVTTASHGWESADYDNRLRNEFDLSWPDLADRVLLRAQAVARAFDTRLHPPGSAGQVRYIEGVRFLSELLIPRGWRPRRESQVCRLVDHRRRTALVVQSGDVATGLPRWVAGRDPRTKYPRGEAVLRAVAANQPALPSLEDELNDGFTSVPTISQLHTWFFLVHVDARAIRSEISLPEAWSDTGVVNAWRDRIILPELSNDGTAIDDDFGGPEDGGGDIDFPVQPI
jgi:hypothetical protein